MLVTKADIKQKFMVYGEVTIPKGTPTTHQTACGVDEDYNFISTFAWVPPHEDGTPQHALIHDLTYYGLNIQRHLLEKI